MNLSKMTISASFPTSREPFDESMRKIRAGVSVIMRTASVRGTLASCTIVLTKRSVVATLPAKAERSGIFATPSSIITF